MGFYLKQKGVLIGKLVDHTYSFQKQSTKQKSTQMGLHRLREILDIKQIEAQNFGLFGLKNKGGKGKKLVGGPRK